VASSALDIREKRAGRVLTPLALAGALCRWGIRSAGDVVIDLGVGEGAFALAAVARLRTLGADDAAAIEHVYGAEADSQIFERAQREAVAQYGRPLPNVVCANFYDLGLPVADVVVGNPPYIRRHHLDDPSRLRAASGARNATGLTDAYCYFLAKACAALRPGGRLAVIVSASWLDMKYGQDLRRLLLEQFRVRLLLGFDGRVFPDALVKPVVLLAEKQPSNGCVAFARLAQEAPFDALDSTLDDLTAGSSTANVEVARVAQSELSPTAPWSPYLKTPDVYADILKEAPLTSLVNVAESRIGLQTFAKGFYILTREQADGWRIEPEYLLPLLFSPRELTDPLIDDPRQLRYVVFVCDQPLEKLGGTAAARYVRQGMRAVVGVRGKDELVRGFHQAPRLLRAGRRPWYNIRTEILRRGAYPILLPRRVFRSYLVAHNRAGVVANEDFIEVRPRAGEQAVLALLAFLNSSFGEFLLRSHSFQYGGGVFNLNPGPVRDVPVLDTGRLPAIDMAELAGAWVAFTTAYGSGGERAALDRSVGNVLALSAPLQQRVVAALGSLVELTRTANRTYRESTVNQVVTE
jgi:adenine-specific DNA-methyltransferase